MAEIKRTFTAARMNKDLDERLVPNGEYRDAMNIQIRTTDGDAAGTVQNIQGNTRTSYFLSPTLLTGFNTTSIDGNSLKTKCVGKVADERNDKAYFLFASPELRVKISEITGSTKFVDYILEQDSNGTFTPVVVDFWALVERYADFNGSFNFNANSNFITATDGSKYRVGMSVQAYTSAGSPIMKGGTKIVKITGNNLFLNKDHVANSGTCNHLIFNHPKALGFNYNVLITGINVIDNFLFYTTNVSEPKKINISRCKQGCSMTVSPFDSHTKLKLNKDSNTNSLLSFPGTGEEVGLIPAKTGDLLEEHLTVIRKAPVQAPTLVMSDTNRPGVSSFSLVQDFSTHTSGSFVFIEVPDGVNFIEGDNITLTCTNDLVDDSISVIRAYIDNANEFPNLIGIEILSMPTDITASNNNWFIDLEEEGSPLFELKFPRFGYRYKYNDGEYSSFSPFSEIAFLPGKFDYQPKKGHNLGMVNNLRQLKITNVLADDRIKPDDIICIDILYKSTDSPVVYVVKTIEKNIDPEWSTAGTNVLSDIHITSDMVHKALPSDQILRSWDNVPRVAKGQEIVGNRLIYANYVQGYNTNSLSVNQRVISDEITQNLNPEKSVKSLRTYKFGVVYGDKYGRETPVFAIGNQTIATKNTVESQIEDSKTILKSKSNKANRFAVRQYKKDNLFSKAISPWMDYVKYYIKETSTEYYNLVMERWYNAEDGNVWLAFASSDRNKVDEETYLILKNENGSDVFVEEEARYKIIAISSEAPDFIKTVGRTRGGNQVAESDSQYSNNEPTVLMTSLIFSLNGFKIEEPKGVLRVRIKAVGTSNTLYSGYREVTRYTNPIVDGVSNSDGEIQIDSVFFQEANFAQLFVNNEDYTDIAGATNLSTGITYYLEFKDDVVENRPEFDGRFFVKILKDNTLEDKVMSLSTLQNSYVYTTVSSTDFDYIDNTSSTNPAATGEQKDYVFSNMPQYFAGYFNFFNDRAKANVSNIFIDAVDYKAILGSNTTLIPGISSSELSDFLSKFPLSGSERGFAKSGMEGVDTSTHDRIYFAVFQPNYFTGGNSELETNQFYIDITSAGTQFRFKNDPNNSIYRVVQNGSENTDSPYIVNYPWINTASQYTMAQPLVDNLSSNQYRSSFFTTFRRIDPATGLVTNKGINFNDWDPRGDMKHDGSQARQIEIVQKTDIYNGKIVPSPNAGIWETEPKDSVDLDIYYEASNAIPMRLNYENTPMFAPVGSIVNVVRNGSTIDLGAVVVVGKCLDKAVKLVTQNTNTAFTAVAILVNDIIVFTHADGTKTKARVSNWLDATAADLGVIKTVTATISLQASHFGAAGSSKLAPSNGLSNEQNGLLDDMSITGGNLPANTFIHNPPTTASFFNVTDASDTLVVTGSSGTNESDNTTYTINANNATGYYNLDPEVWKNEVELPWFNCYSFGNGVESDRIRDDFNAPTIDNGVNVSTVLSDYQAEHRQNGLIYSGIYNSNSSVNNLNEFNMSQKITKDLNPAYGSIQALKTRDTDLITLTEDKVLRILANKDALFNADGNTNLTSSDRVLGQAVPYVGDYGISKNPESLAVDQYRMYFTDRQRGAVLRLSRDGLTPISNVGMRTWFRDNLHKSNQLIGSFDTVSGEYNISLKYSDLYSNVEYPDTTVSFNESGKGWVSFKSFVTDSGVSVSGNYYTTFGSSIYKHHVDVKADGSTVNRNTFYDLNYVNSTINAIFNDAPGSIKNFKTLNYEGSEGKKISFNQLSTVSPSGVTVNNLTSDGFDALDGLNSSVPYIATERKPVTTGWGFESIITDLQSGSAIYVKEKEGKWFSDIAGDFNVTNISSIDESEFNVQGLGTASVQPVYSSGSQTSYSINIDGGG